MQRIISLYVFILLFLLTSTYSYSQNTENTASGFSIDESRLDKRHWLYFGWAEDHPKAISLMGGAVYPRRPKLPERDDHSWDHSRLPWHKNSSDPVLFMLSVDNCTPYYPDEHNIYRRKIIDWSVAEDYLPFPVSQWKKDHIMVKITHVGRRILDNSVNAVYTQVILTNTDIISHEVKLVVNGNHVVERVFPIKEVAFEKPDIHRIEIPATLPVET